MSDESQVWSALGSDCPRGHCYRCWQVLREEKATCIVQHAWGTTKSWTAPSCQSCADRDLKAFPRSRVIARILTNEARP